MRILSVLETDELSVGELMRVLDTPQSTMSRHLKALRTGGWVTRRSEGTAGWFQAVQRDGASGDLWQLVRAAAADSPDLQADRERLAGVLAAREVDSETFFGRMHDRWDALRRQLFGDGYVLPTLLALLPEDQCIADLGCGTGDTVAAVAPWVRRVIGVDRERGMLQTAAARTAHLKNVELRTGGLDDLPLTDGEADMAVCMLVLHHVDDLDRAFAEARRAIRQRLVVLDMVAHERTQYHRTMGHRHLGFDRDALTALAEAHGWRILHWRVLPVEEGVQGPALFLAVFG
ncbi:MAG: SAM-dependent methyltransferase [Myxococcota bacterium]